MQSRNCRLLSLCLMPANNGISFSGMLSRSERSIWEGVIHQYCPNTNGKASKHTYHTLNNRNLSAPPFWTDSYNKSVAKRNDSGHGISASTQRLRTPKGCWKGYVVSLLSKYHPLNAEKTYLLLSYLKRTTTWPIPSRIIFPPIKKTSEMSKAASRLTTFHPRVQKLRNSNRN